MKKDNQNRHNLVAVNRELIVFIEVLVEAGGVEPPSENIPLKLLHT